MKNESESWLIGVVYDNAPSMDELQRVDAELADPLESFLARRSQEVFLSKSAVGPEPDWSDVLGVVQVDDTHDDRHLEKRLTDFSKRSSSPFRLRESIEVVDGERIILRYNHRGEVENMIETQ